MAFKYREEIVGKRFLCVPNTGKLKLSRISDWNWKAGVIRASSHRDTKSSELSVLVEFDGVDWSKREWIKVFDGSFSIFFVEKTLCWAERRDPNNPSRTLLWPCLNFKSVVDKASLSSYKTKPVEFFSDLFLTFLEDSELRPHTESALTLQPVCREYPETVVNIGRWTKYQDGQSILLTTPSVLFGSRVEVYRAEGTTQWYTAVILSYNESTRELTVTDDTVLENHNEDPSLIQMKILGDRVIDAILKGDNIGIVPRRRSTVQPKEQSIANTSNTSTRTQQNHCSSPPWSLPKLPRQSRHRNDSTTPSLPEPKSPQPGDKPKTPLAKPLPSSPVQKVQPKTFSARTPTVKAQGTFKDKEKKRRSDELESAAIILKRAKSRERSEVDVYCAEKVVDSGAKKDVKSDLQRSKVKTKSDTKSVVVLENISKKHSRELVSEKQLNRELPPRLKQQSISTSQETSSSKKTNPPCSSSKPVTRLKQPRRESVSILKPLVEREASRLQSDRDLPLVLLDSLTSGSDDCEGIKVQHKDTTVIIKELDSFVAKHESKNSSEKSGNNVKVETAPVKKEESNVKQENVKPEPKAETAKPERAQLEREKVSESSDLNVKAKVVKSEKADVESAKLDNPSSVDIECKSNSRDIRTSASSRLVPRTEPLCTWRDPAHSGSDTEVRRASSVQPPHSMQPHRSSSVQPNYPGAMTESLHSSLSQPQPHSSSLYNPLGYSHPMGAAGLRPMAPLSMMQRDTYLQYHQLMAQYQGYSQMSPAQMELLRQQQKAAGYPSMPLHQFYSLPHHYQEEIARARLADRDRLEREQKEQSERERERIERDRAERDKLERERLDRERQEQKRAEQERLEKEKAERERLERERERQREQERVELRKKEEAEAAVTQHFQESLRKFNKMAGQQAQWSNLAPTAAGGMPQASPVHSKHGGMKEESRRDQSRVADRRELQMSQERVMSYDPRMADFHRQQQQYLEHQQRLRYEEALRQKQHQQQQQQQQQQSTRQLPQHQQTHPVKKEEKSPGEMAPHHRNSPRGTELKQEFMQGHPAYRMSYPLTEMAAHHIKQEANFSLYGYRPFQHSYISQDKLDQLQQQPGLRDENKFGSMEYDRRGIDERQMIEYGRRTAEHEKRVAQLERKSAEVEPAQRSADVERRPPELERRSAEPDRRTGVSPGTTSHNPKKRFLANPPPLIRHEEGLGNRLANASVVNEQVPTPASPASWHSGRSSSSPRQQREQRPSSTTVTVITSNTSPHNSNSTSPPTANRAAVPHMSPGSQFRGMPSHQMPFHSDALIQQGLVPNPMYTGGSLPPGQLPYHQYTSQAKPVAQSSLAHPMLPNITHPPAKRKSDVFREEEEAKKPRYTETTNSSTLGTPKPSVPDVANMSTSAFTGMEMPPHAQISTTPAWTAKNCSPLQNTQTIAEAQDCHQQQHYQRFLEDKARMQSQAVSVSPPTRSSTPGSQGTIVTSVTLMPSKASTPSASSTTSEPAKMLTNGLAESDSETRSAASSPPVNRDQASSPCKSNPTKLKKAWLQRHSDEDSNKAPVTGPAAEENSQSSVVKSCKVDLTMSKAPESIKLYDQNNEMANKASKVKNPAGDAEKERKTSSSDSHSNMDTSETNIDKTLRSRNNAKRESSKDSKKGQEKNGKKKPREPATSSPAAESDQKNTSRGRPARAQQKNAKDATGTPEEVPKKRGRKPKAEKEKTEKDKEKDVKPEKEVKKPKKPADGTFLQDGSCSEVTPKLAKCRECKMTPLQKSKNMPNIFCRFYAFRRLKKSSKGVLQIAGFSEPADAVDEDMKPWLPQVDVRNHLRLDPKVAKYILGLICDQFCDLVEQETEARGWATDDVDTAWKRVVQGVREMCDVCETTLFNYHWVCHKCGFVVCLDCYRARKELEESDTDKNGHSKDRDKYNWLTCNNKSRHEMGKLMLTQIIPGNALMDIKNSIMEVRSKWNIPDGYPCNSPTGKASRPNGLHQDILAKINSRLADGINREKLVNGLTDRVTAKKNGTNRNSPPGGYSPAAASPLSWLADVALNSSQGIYGSKTKIESVEPGKESDNFELAEEDKTCSTLRNLLTKSPSVTSGNGGGSGKVSDKFTNHERCKASPANTKTIDEVISCVIEQSLSTNCSDQPERTITLSHYVPRQPRLQSKVPLLQPVKRTLMETSVRYPDVPHSWLCDGRVLRLHDHFNKANFKLFQEQWKCGLPVVVSSVHKALNSDIWRPETFCKEFGNEKVDLVNYRTGTVHSNQSMKSFWDGFEKISKRMKDDADTPMLLKVKDWPPSDDFSLMLPSRFEDLANNTPIPEYTRRDGLLNLAARLPDFFVRPDLGPRMYLAYGSASYPREGTANLHLEVSDAVNILVHVGGSEDDIDSEAVLKAIEGANVDMSTKARVRENKEPAGALWHVYPEKDADRIRDLLNKVAMERGEKPSLDHDPIHEQSWYLDSYLRERLYKEYNVEGFCIVQFLGDAVFIPAGVPHQVRNLQSCIKVAQDFVSPEGIGNCFKLTQESRQFAELQSRHEDKLQIKNIIYHAVKDSVGVLQHSDVSDC